MSLNTDFQNFTYSYNGKTEIDFGSLPLASKEFTVTDVNIFLDSNVSASLAYESTTTKELDEMLMDKLSIVCGEVTLGSFKMVVSTVDGSYLEGTFKINYSV